MTTSDTTWRLAEHVCRSCFGRILERRTPDGDTVFRCSNCGKEGAGDVREICACGMRLRNGRSAGVRCSRNHNPSPAMPGEIVAVTPGG